MNRSMLAAACALGLALFVRADEPGAASRDVDVVKPRIVDQLARVTLNESELDGELDRRISNLVDRHFMAIDVDAGWLNHFRNRTARGDRQYVYYGIGKVIDAGSLFAAYTGDPRVAARTRYLVDTLAASRDPDGYLGFWAAEPENRQNHINWILHEQEYINLALVRHYRCTGDARSLEHARIMGDYILRTFPTPANPCFDAGAICTAGLPEGMLELYRVTGDPRYLEFAADVPHGNNRGEVQLASLRTWEQDFSRRPCHVYVMLARCYAQTELHRLTGEPDLLRMSEFMRNELLKRNEGGMLVTGSCSDGEQFTYNQNGKGAIGESCVTAYVLRWIDSLMRIEGDLRYGDLMERTIHNALFAANSPDGRWIRYFTPFTGERVYDTRDSFCCCGNYRRAVAEIPQKVYYRTPDGGIAINLFTASNKTFTIGDRAVAVRQETDYPSEGEVAVTFSIPDKSPLAFPFRFRTPAWCDQITVRVNGEAPRALGDADRERGGHTLRRVWNDGDVVRISMPMRWRFIRGRAAQQGRVALLRGPIVYCLGKDQNAETLARVADPRDLVIDPVSLGDPVRDDATRPDGRKVAVKAWLDVDGQREPFDVTLTEFIDPSGREVYLRWPDNAPRSPVPVTDDEIVSWPNRFVNAHVVKALYGPKATGDIESYFEVRGDVIADLAADYANPGGKPAVDAEFPDRSGGRWTYFNCANGGILADAAAPDVKRLNSRFKAFGSPVGFAFGLEGQDDELGFVSDYAPSDRQEEKWRTHYTEGMFDPMIAVPERSTYLYTHPIADAARYGVFRWTPGPAAPRTDVTLAGTLFSNMGNGVTLRVIRWKGDGSHEVLGTFDTSQAAVAEGSRGSAEFVIERKADEADSHVDFVLHNGGSHICDATAIRIRAFTNARRGPAQKEVTDVVRARFRGKLVTPLGPYADLFGEGAGGADATLKIQFRFWREGVMKYVELPSGSPIDLSDGKR
ncbi:MAG: hypothetical protein FJ297_08250 [Planctomycetes bacterium]|nr:hypothetical protein [Planctomycetota bacterium]